jgi:hypothetical protein
MAAYDGIDDLLDVLQPVTVRVQRTSGVVVVAPTRVLDFERRGDAAMVIVACPADVDASEHHFEAELSWTHPLGRVSCAVATHPGRRPYGAVWVLAPRGPARRVQERRHFRVRMTVPLRLSWDDMHSEAFTVDVSEGGVLALLRDEPPDVGSVVDTTLVVDGTELSGPGTVVRHVPYPGGVGIGVMFPEVNANADTLRRAAFDAERRRVSRGAR